VLFFYFQVTLVEEKEMKMKFGRAYLEYKKRVPGFLPRLSHRR